MPGRTTPGYRRAIFAAREEARRYGSPLIEPHHLLLGLLREDWPWKQLAGSVNLKDVRHEIEARTEDQSGVNSGAEIPLSDATKHALNYAVGEADKFGHVQIGAEHLLLGILRDKNSLAANIMRSHGIKLEGVLRVILTCMPPEDDASG